MANQYRHQKETFYFGVCASISALVWMGIIIGSFGIAFLFLIPIAFMGWITKKYLEVFLYGQTVKVSEQQLPELNSTYIAIAKNLGITNPPEMFILDGGGVKNAFALKLLGTKYVILTSDVIDACHSAGPDCLNFIIAHELAHHQAGHTSFWKNLLIKPSLWIPFLGSAYSRACEYTADGIALNTTKNQMDAGRALTILAVGSHLYAKSVEPIKFAAQENAVPSMFGFFVEASQSHPRLTKRVAHIMELSHVQLSSRSFVA